MDRFELSERWCSWKDLDAIFAAARVAIEAGPFDPVICEVVFNEEYDPSTVDTLEEAREHLLRNPRITSDPSNETHNAARPWDGSSATTPDAASDMFAPQS
jgi:hypothetical protein